MKDFEPIDEDTGIEEYPGYIGMTWDRDLFMSDKFKFFEKFEVNSIKNVGKILL